ncbi:MAG TPA: phospholipase D-like domain-containing protein [Pirellulales bacterium]|nr:phospholipase D-like domain-containing protein [Pirellulales bacterium]
MPPPFDIDWEQLATFWPHALGVVSAALAVPASLHCLLHKRDSRAAIAWVGLIWLTPLLGTLLYVLLGINRIQRRARSLRGGRGAVARRPDEAVCTEHRLDEILLPDHEHLRSLVRMVERVTGLPLVDGNQVEPLINGEMAYPAMLASIDAARRSIALSTYLFNHDALGLKFVEALARAVARKVEVRVLIDDIGARYSFPSIVRPLRRRHVPVARFLPTLLRRRFAYSNLRNHRKLLVVDGQVGFTGGMNILDAARFRSRGKTSLADLHFRCEGPVVGHLARTFAADWDFAANESLAGEAWFPQLAPRGPVAARGILDGPDEDHDKLRLTLLGGLACARSQVSIVTPYFLPDEALITALNVAALRGVKVDVLLPERNNLVLLEWASRSLWWQILEHGCRIWLSPPPFDHTKLMVVDGLWSLVGSANWDPRSLRLNFEFDVECYDAELAQRLEAIVESKRRAARAVTLADADGRKLPVKLRDSVARLLSPYL